MKLQLRDLPGLLSRAFQAVYWVSGDDVFLTGQAVRDVVSVAQKRGYAIERESFPSGVFAERFFTLTHAGSLFASQRCVVLNLELKDAKFLPVLSDYLRAPDPELIVVLVTGKLSVSVSQHADFKRLEALPSGFCHLPIWPIDRDQLPGFLVQHAKRYQLSVPLGVAQKMAALTEGNLFAADQLLEKLSLCPNAGKITDADLSGMADDESRFELFDLVSAALQGDLRRTWQIWERLQTQKVEPILVLWALAKDIRLLASLHEKQREQSLPVLLKQHKFWEKRAREVSAGLARLSYARCLALLQQAAQVDRVIKGVEPGDAVGLLGNLLRGMVSVELPLRPAMVGVAF